MWLLFFKIWMVFYQILFKLIWFVGWDNIFLGWRETNNKISNTFIMIQKGFTLILNSIWLVKHVLSIFHEQMKPTSGNETPSLSCLNFQCRVNPLRGVVGVLWCTKKNHYKSDQALKNIINNNKLTKNLFIW